MKIPFNIPLVYGDEIGYIKQVLKSRRLSGSGEFAEKCQELMEKKFDAEKVMLTTSCTHALEMASLLIGLKPGDEVICPSYTFVSTVNSFVLRGVEPVFVDIREDTLNMDETKIEEKITDKTKAILPVHYAGVGCEMSGILKIAEKNNLFVIEDAAQGVNAKYNDEYLGTIGDIGAYSFHETKNYTCGEGGAIILNDERFVKDAEIIREKGTNRSIFLRGEVDKYTWVSIGSSYIPSEILAAFLYCQLKNADEIMIKRKDIYDYYYENLKNLEGGEKLRLPIIPQNCETNYHMFYILLDNENNRNKLLRYLKEKGAHAAFHFLPLHTAPMGKKFGYKEGDLPSTEDISGRIIRLPMFYDLTSKEQDYVINNIYAALNTLSK